MNEQKTYQQLLQDVADLKQIVCELARYNAMIGSATFSSWSQSGELEFDNEAYELTNVSAAIARRLNPVNFCLDCDSPLRYRMIPASGLDGVGCDCPDKPLLDISTFDRETPNPAQAAVYKALNIGFIPPSWQVQNPCEEAVVGQWPPDHMG